MGQSTVSANYSAITTIGALHTPCADTSLYFDTNFVANKAESAIDSFIRNCEAINKLWVGSAQIEPEFGRILLLGYVSAIESFFRSIFSSIINNDLKAQDNAHSYVVPYGAALFHDKEVLADALLEGYSFSGEKEIKKAFDKFLEVGNTDPIKELLTDYEKICQMRHCCVHRFGKLGSTNGIALGLHAHKKALEKPLKLDKNSIEAIASWLMSFAKAINNYIFQILLERTVHKSNPYKIEWKWSYNADRIHFEKIYNICKTHLDTYPSPSCQELYSRFELAMQPRKPSKK